MPIYEFVCQDCGHEFEKILSFSHSGTSACPACGAAQVERRLGRPAIHFKGSGWYITDSKKGNKSESRSETGATNGKTDAKVDAKADGGSASPSGNGANGASGSGGAEKKTTEKTKSSEK